MCSVGWKRDRRTLAIPPGRSSDSAGAAAAASATRPADRSTASFRHDGALLGGRSYRRAAAGGDRRACPRRSAAFGARRRSGRAAARADATRHPAAARRGARAHGL
eukprot:7379377-Prymnesium_polylepis.2